MESYFEQAVACVKDHVLPMQRQIYKECRTHQRASRGAEQPSGQHEDRHQKSRGLQKADRIDLYPHLPCRLYLCHGWPGVSKVQEYGVLPLPDRRKYGAYPEAHSRGARIGSPRCLQSCEPIRICSSHGGSVKLITIKKRPAKDGNVFRWFCIYVTAFRRRWRCLR